MSDSYVPFLIPIVLLLGSFAIAIIAILAKTWSRERMHRERMFLAEKGLEIPKELYETREPKRPSDFRGGRAWLMILGTILVFVGIGVMIAVGISHGIGTGINGIIPFLIGVGLLVSERLIARSVAKANQ
jgi:hypothetical protein